MENLNIMANNVFSAEAFKYGMSLTVGGIIGIAGVTLGLDAIRGGILLGQHIFHKAIELYMAWRMKKPLSS